MEWPTLLGKCTRQNSKRKCKSQTRPIQIGDPIDPPVYPQAVRDKCALDLPWPAQVEPTRIPIGLPQMPQPNNLYANTMWVLHPFFDKRRIRPTLLMANLAYFIQNPRAMLPMYHRSSSSSQNPRIQRRSVLYISEPVPQLPHAKDPESLIPAAAPESPRTHSKAPASMVLWMGGALFVFWLVILTLFFMFHMMHTNPTPLRKSNVFKFVLPANLSYFIAGLQGVSEYHICCWHPTDGTLHCNLMGVIWDSTNKQILFGPAHTHLIGGQCTFHSVVNATF